MLTTEEEGIAIATGAWLGGTRSVVLMQSSGVGNCINMLSSPNILSCHNTTGQDDYLLQVVAANLGDYSAFVENTLRQLPGVSSIRSNLSMREIKSTTRLPVGLAVGTEG